MHVILKLIWPDCVLHIAKDPANFLRQPAELIQGVLQVKISELYLVYKLLPKLTVEGYPDKSCLACHLLIIVKRCGEPDLIHIDNDKLACQPQFNFLICFALTRPCVSCAIAFFEQDGERSCRR